MFNLYLHIGIITIGRGRRLVRVIRFQCGLNYLREDRNFTYSYYVPCVTIIVKILRAIRGLLRNVRLMETGRRRTFISLVRCGMLTGGLTRHALIRRHYNGLLRIIRQGIYNVHPIRYRLRTTVQVINRVTDIRAVECSGRLSMVGRSVREDLIVTLCLIMYLFRFRASTLRFCLGRERAVSRCHRVMATFLSALGHSLVKGLGLILAPIDTIRRLRP